MRQSEKVETFVEAYLKNKDEIEAVKTVCNSENHEVLRVKASKLMNDPEVKKLISEARSGIDRKGLIKELNVILQNETDTDKKVKIIGQLERVLRLSTGHSQSEWEAQYLNLVALGDILSDFIDGRTASFEEIFNPTLDKNGKVRFNVKKNDSLECRQLKMLTLFKELIRQKVLI